MTEDTYTTRQTIHGSKWHYQKNENSERRKIGHKTKFKNGEHIEGRERETKGKETALETNIEAADKLRSWRKNQYRCIERKEILVRTNKIINKSEICKQHVREKNVGCQSVERKPFS